MIQVGSKVRILDETNGDAEAAHLPALVGKEGVVVTDDPDLTQEWFLVDVGETISGFWMGMPVHTHDGMQWDATPRTHTHWWMHVDFLAEV